MNRIRYTLLMAIMIFTIIACDTAFNDEIVEEGQFMIWSNFDGPPIDIFIDGKIYGTISQFYLTKPSCGSDGCVTITLSPGVYNFMAVEQSNNGTPGNEWEGTINVEPNICKTLGLTSQ